MLVSRTNFTTNDFMFPITAESSIIRNINRIVRLRHILFLNTIERVRVHCIIKKKRTTSLLENRKDMCIELQMSTILKLQPFSPVFFRNFIYFTNISKRTRNLSRKLFFPTLPTIHYNPTTNRITLK